MLESFIETDSNPIFSATSNMPNENYYYTIMKRKDGNLSRRVGVPFKVMTVMLNRILHAMDSLDQELEWLAGWRSTRLPETTTSFSSSLFTPTAATSAESPQTFAPMTVASTSDSMRWKRASPTHVPWPRMCICTSRRCAAWPSRSTMRPLRWRFTPTSAMKVQACGRRRLKSGFVCAFIEGLARTLSLTLRNLHLIDYTSYLMFSFFELLYGILSIKLNNM